MRDTNEGLIAILLDTATIVADQAVALNSWWASARLGDEMLGSFLIRQGVFIGGAARVLDLCNRGYLKIDNPGALLHEEGRDRLSRGLESASTPSPSIETGSTSGDSRFPPAGNAVAKKTTRRVPAMGEALGRCVLTGEIGRGVTGTLYRALHTDLRISVAVKVPDLDAGTDAIAEFDRKARLLSQLDHRHVVRVLGYDDEPIPHLILEYVHGITLQDLIVQAGRLQFERAASIVLQIARALEASSRQGLILGCVSPANILLAADGSAKLAHYDLADCDSSPGRHDERLSGRSALYRVPESHCDETVDRMSDLYSLGATFYHAVTGLPPSSRSSVSEASTKFAASEELASLAALGSDLPPTVADLIQKMMATAPGTRFDDYATVISRLEGFARPLHPDEESTSSTDAPLNRKFVGRRVQQVPVLHR